MGAHLGDAQGLGQRPRNKKQSLVCGRRGVSVSPNLGRGSTLVDSTKDRSRVGVGGTRVQIPAPCKSLSLGQILSSGAISNPAQWEEVAFGVNAPITASPLWEGPGHRWKCPAQWPGRVCRAGTSNGQSAFSSLSLVLTKPQKTSVWSWIPLKRIKLNYKIRK